MQIRWTFPAVTDFENISAYIESEAGLDTANRVCRILVASIQMLQSQPRMGRPGKRADTRELVEGNYVIVYRVHPEAVEILRIWHSAQNRP
jgi:plasmid stabilization system protein ParE